MDELFLPPWERYPKKLKKKLSRLSFLKAPWTEEEAKNKGMRLAIGKEGPVTLAWLVDPTDGIIADARFLSFGPPPLLALVEGACELSLRKTYAQAQRLTASLLEKQVRDPEDPPFPLDTYLNWILMAIDQAAEQCSDIPVAPTYEETPLAGEEGGRVLENWAALDDKQKIDWIEEIIDKEIRPYIELDAGGITFLELKEGHQVYIRYQGSCTSCHASTGSTLSAIQNILNTRLDPSIAVIPEL